MANGMNLSRSRYGRSRNNNPRLPGTKAELMDALQAKGLTLEIGRENVGQWNECRNFKVGDRVIDVVMKSGKPDWDAMIKEVEKL